ncbi:MAG: hypothetical protein ACK5S1_00570, partial [bacterium]
MVERREAGRVDHATVGIEHAAARLGRAAADPLDRTTRRGARRLSRVALRGRSGEKQLVVVSAGKRAALFHLVRLCPQRGRARNRGPQQFRPHARPLADVAEIAEQPVGDVDTTRSQATQAQAERDAGFGAVEALADGVERAVAPAQAGAQCR